KVRKLVSDTSFRANTCVDSTRHLPGCRINPGLCGGHSSARYASGCRYGRIRELDTGEYH
ncbi:MAG: hypothetical protein MK238_00770, partial [Nitrospinales bacterium]|nr:hypothetical protein [Nitrospinales bacterium]